MDNKWAKDFEDGKMVISPFSIRFDFKFNDVSYYTRNVVSDIGAFEAESERINLIRMNDGVEYYLIAGSTTAEGDNDGNIKETVDYTISMTNDKDNPQMIAIDIENVKEVVIGGETISIS